MSFFENFMLPCLNKKLFGFECMGCGLQRSIVLLIKGDFIGALHMYPAIYSLIVLALFIGINYFYKIKHGNKIINALAIISISIIIVNYFIKLIN